MYFCSKLYVLLQEINVNVKINFTPEQKLLMHKKKSFVSLLTLYSCTKHIYLWSANSTKAKDQHNKYSENVSVHRGFSLLF